MRVAVLGSNGQLGTDLMGTVPVGLTPLAHTRADADVTDEAALSAWVASARPQWILNTIAYNRTEEAEDRPAEAFSVNGLGVRAVTRAAETVGARVLHLSTDFVFDGEKGRSYVESDAPRPLGVYAVSKFAGECFVRAASRDHVIVRTASLFGRAGSRSKGGNFVESILKAAATPPLRVVNDIVMSPTFTRDLAERLWAMIQRPVAGGVYHVTNDGSCSWWEFASAILDRAGVRVPVEPRAPGDRLGKTPRGANTALSSEAGPRCGFAPLRPWREALDAYFREKK